MSSQKYNNLEEGGIDHFEKIPKPNQERTVPLFSHVGRFPDHGICQLYSMSPSNNTANILFTIHTFKLNLEIWVEVYSQHYAQELLFTLGICKGNIVQPSIIP